MTAPLDTESTMLEIIKTALLDGDADQLVTLPAQQQSSGLFDYVVIVTARSGRHLKALTNRTLKALKAAGHKKQSVESADDSGWALIDCGDIIIHVMQAAEREHYQLESLWGFENNRTEH